MAGRVYLPGSLRTALRAGRALRRARPPACGPVAAHLPSASSPVTRPRELCPFFCLGSFAFLSSRFGRPSCVLGAVRLLAGTGPGVRPPPAGRGFPPRAPSGACSLGDRAVSAGAKAVPAFARSFVLLGLHLDPIRLE